MKRILITGGCGFIGSHFVEHLIRKTDWDIVIIDMLSYASHGLERLRSAQTLTNPRVRFYSYDLTKPISQGLRQEIGDVTFIVHMAAETHVDNSIANPEYTVHNNVMSTLYTLEYARQLKSLDVFFYFSTDEVYGPALEGVLFTEKDRHTPTNPYSASKSAGEQLCTSYGNTYKLPIITVNVMNAFGERQHVEKFIPKCVRSLLLGQMIEIHADETCTISGSRYYIHARNIADAVLFLIENGEIGELYHVSGEIEVSNLELATKIAGIMGRTLSYKLTNYNENRPGHDLRYALCDKKLQSLGWKVPIGFEHSLEKTVLWSLSNPTWLQENLQDSNLELFENANRCLKELKNKLKKRNESS